MPRDEKTLAQLELVAQIVFHNPPTKMTQPNAITVARVVYDLAKIAHSLHKRYEAACSYEWACTDKYSRRTENLENKAAELGAELGVQVEHQRDPRGWPLIVKVGGYETRLA